MNLSAENIKRKLVVFKFTLSRGYAWCQLPTMALMGAGILYPYTQGMFPWMKMWMLAILALTVFIFVGWLDRKWKLLHKEQSYTIETNPMMMEVVNDVRNKKDDEKTETEKFIKENNLLK
jgi:Leu/Phe-tRNA-protein transferase